MAQSGANRSQPPLPQVGDVVGHYQLVELLATGGSGVVFKAYEQALDRFVAVKLLSAKSAADYEYVHEFFEEARAVARLNHPNIIHIYFIGEHDGLPFFAMELVEGESLHALAQRCGKMSLPDALKWIRQAAVGLQHAHQNGVVHRDIKPGNIMLAHNGVLKLTDFGLAKYFRRAHAATAGFAGTPEFTSPEEARCEKVDHRSDIYSLGATLYYLLAGRPPFIGDTPQAVLRQHTDQRPQPIQRFNSQIPAAADRLLEKMLAKQPAARQQNCEQLIQEIDQLLAARPRALAPNTPIRRPAPAKKAPAPAKNESPVMLIIVIALSIGSAFGLWRLITSPPLPAPEPPPEQSAVAATALEEQAQALLATLNAQANTSLKSRNFNAAWEAYQSWPATKFAGTKADQTVTAERTRIRDFAQQAWEAIKLKAFGLRTRKQHPEAAALYEQAQRDFDAFPDIAKEAAALRQETLADRTLQYNRDAKLQQVLGAIQALIINLEFENAREEVRHLLASRDADLREGLAPVNGELDRLDLLKQAVIRRQASQPATITAWTLRSGKVEGHLVKADAKELVVSSVLPNGATAEATIPWTQLTPATATQLFMLYLDSSNSDEVLAMGILLLHYATHQQARVEDARQTLESVTILDPSKKAIVAGYLEDLREYQRHSALNK